MNRKFFHAQSQPHTYRGICNRDVRASIAASMPIVGMTFDIAITQAMCYSAHAESLVDQTYLRLDTTGRENRLIHSHHGSSNTER